MRVVSVSEWVVNEWVVECMSVQVVHIYVSTVPMTYLTDLPDN